MSKAVTDARVLRLLFMALLPVACSEPIEPGYSHAELPENPGLLLASDAVHSSPLAWSLDGERLFYVARPGGPTGGAERIVEITLADRSTRILDATGLQYPALEVASDGSLLYTAYHDWDALPSAYRIAAGSTEPARLTDRLHPTGPGLVKGAARGASLLAHAGRIAIIVEPDSLFIGEGAADVFVTTGCEGVVAWSPGGERVLCSRSTAAGASWEIVALQDGERQPISFPEDPHGGPRMIHWGADGVRVVSRVGAEYGLADAGATATTPLIEPLYDRSYFTMGMAWSPDGTQAAFTEYVCLGFLWDGCDGTPQHMVRLVDLATGRDSVVVVVHVQTEFQALSFSPDGSRLAFVDGRRVAVQELERP